MRITGIRGGYPLMSGYPQKDEQSGRRMRRKHSKSGRTDGVEISEAAYELAKELDREGEAPAA